MEKHEQEIKILALNFQVEEVECISHGSGDIGRIIPLEQKILIKKGISKERKKVVLLHEAMHSIFEQLGFYEENDNEHLIECLSLSIVQVLEDNKKFISSLD